MSKPSMNALAATPGVVPSTASAASAPLKLVSPSALYAVAAKVKPITSAVATVDSHCVMCAANVCAGDDTNIVTRDTFSDAFNNKLDVRAPNGRYLCGHCMALWHKDFLQRYSKTYATRDGVYKFASNDDVMAFLSNPPAPPFVVFASTTQQQHLVWRTPVNYSREVIRLRLGDQVLTIRRKVLEQATADWARLCELMREAKLKGSMPATMERNLDHARIGSVRNDVQAAAKAAGEDALLCRMTALSFGEWWALNVTRQYLGKPIPEPVRLMIERSE